MTYRQVAALLVLALALGALLPGGAGSAQVASMSVTDIGLPDGATNITPVSINSNGDILVIAEIDGQAVTYVYRNTEFQQFGGADGSATGEAINDSGAIAGWRNVSEMDAAVLIGEENLVEMPGDFVSSKAYGVNSEGVLAGEALFGASEMLSSPVYWTATTIERLPSAGSGVAGAVNDLNTIEQMVGWSALDAEGTVRHATLWDAGAATDLGTLGGNLSEAHAINETGQIVGASTTAGNQDSFESAGSSAFSWQDGQITDLGLSDLYAWGVANDVNDVGMIVGTVGLASPATDGNTTVAALWTGQELLDLNEISSGGEGLTLVEAVAVNGFGQILCRAVDAEGNTRIAVLSIIGN